jgi:regulatory protein
MESEKILFNTVLKKTMAQCSRREFCRNDILIKMDSWGLGENECEKVITILIQENFINEERFARAFVRDKFNYNKWGKIKIANHLRAKKLPPAVISSALDSIDNEQYIKLIRALIENHRRTVRAKNQYDLKAKLLRYGLSKGFESSILYDILNDIEE